MDKHLHHKKIQTLIYSRKLKLSLLGTYFAWFIGMLIACVVLNLYSGFSDYLSTNSSKKDYDFNIIHKSVGLMNTLGISSTNFTPSELNKIKSQDFIIEVAPVISNEFKVGIDGGTMLRFYTELFLQAVPNQFLDINTDKFTWQEGKEVPIIVNNSFIDLYNHGFAISQGLPQLPKSIITKKQLILKIRGNGKNINIPCRIYGFTDRISSILVPESFIHWANAIYGQEESKTSSVLIQSDASEGKKLSAFLNQHTYEYNKEMLNINQTKVVVKSFLLFLVIISLLIVGLAIGMSYFIAKTILYEKAHFIEHLHWLGYPFKSILSPLLAPLIKNTWIFSALVISTAFLINYLLNLSLQRIHFNIPAISSALLIFWILSSLISIYIVQHKIKTHLKRTIS